METAPSAKTTDYLTLTLRHTKSAFTIFFDAIDSIDRKLYGKRMKVFIWVCILVLIVAPIFDELLGVKNDRITYLSTLIFFIIIVIFFLSFISTWRDDTGNWSLNRAKSRIQTYYSTFKDTFDTTRTSSKDENLFQLGQSLFFFGIIWKALQNLSVFLRKPIEGFLNSRVTLLRQFEKVTTHYYWIPICLGIAIILYLINKNPLIFERIKNEIRQLLGWVQGEQQKRTNEIRKFETRTTKDLVINAKAIEQINKIKANSNSILFNDFVTALHNWNPRNSRHEYVYQDWLYRHLRKSLPGAVVELEYPIGDAILGSNGRADIVINDTILIELKRDSSAGAVQRAKGQILQYSETWGYRGPVVLLLCDYDYDHAKLSFTSTMSDLKILERPVITIIAKPK